MTDQWEAVDLTALDPARRPEWAERVEATRRAVAVVLRGRARPEGPLEVLSGWARPILAAAAVLLAILGGADALLHRSITPTPERLGEARRLALLSEISVTRGHLPSGAELRTILRVAAR
jgi:hypothetical protein